MRHGQAIKIQAMFRGRRVERWQVTKNRGMGRRTLLLLSVVTVAFQLFVHHVVSSGAVRVVRGRVGFAPSTSIRVVGDVVVLCLLVSR